MPATSTSIGERIERAVIRAGVTQRKLARQTGISQPTLSRIISGERPAKLTEVVAIAWATGRTVAELTGISAVPNRAVCAARATNGSDMTAMRDTLMHFLELDAYLEDQGIPAATA